VHKKCGKCHEMPANHNLKAYLDANIKAAGVRDESNDQPAGSEDNFSAGILWWVFLAKASALVARPRRRNGKLPPADTDRAIDKCSCVIPRAREPERSRQNPSGLRLQA
jgi:NAD-dependent dihydropyrimidine dehydrogenase PreA subunit